MGAPQLDPEAPTVLRELADEEFLLGNCEDGERLHRAADTCQEVLGRDRSADPDAWLLAVDAAIALLVEVIETRARRKREGR